MAQRALHPLHRPVALPCPTRPQAQPRAARPIRRRQRACLRAPADAQPGLIQMLHARPARRQRLDRDARPPQSPRSPDAQRRQHRRRHPRPEQHRQDLRQTPGRRLRKPVARGRLAAVAALQPKAALQRRYPLDKTRTPASRSAAFLRLQARNLLLQTPRYRHRQRLSLRSAAAHVPVHPCSRHIANPQTIESIPGSHAMSCFVCVPAHILRMFWAWRFISGGARPVFRPVVPAWRFRHGALLSAPFRSLGPAAGAPVQRNPFPRVSRVRAPAPGRARFAAARIARPIAPRAREGETQGRAGAPGFASGLPGFASSAWVPPFAAVSFFRPRRRPASGWNPFPRVSRACALAPGRARYAAARFARPICACAREARRRVGQGRRGSARLFRLCVFGMGSLLAQPFRSSGPAAGLPGQRNPFPRVTCACAPAPGRARYAAARFARLIAPARARPNAGRTCPPGFPRGVFFAPARNRRGYGAADAVPFPPTHP